MTGLFDGFLLPRIKVFPLGDLVEDLVGDLLVDLEGLFSDFEGVVPRCGRWGMCFDAL